jgi:phage terminase large subunit-like protein
LTLRDEFAGSLKRRVIAPSILGYTPYEGAQQSFHVSPAVGRLLLGGNRAGKTVGGATESVWWLCGTHPYQRTPDPPVWGRGVSVDIEQGLKKIMLPELARWLPKSALIGGSWEQSYDKQARVLTLANGSRMDFLTGEMDAEKHAGTSRNFCWIDEETAEHIFNENMLRLVDVQGHWWLTMTPVLGMTWVYRRYYEPYSEGVVTDETRNLAIFSAPTDDNPYLPPGALDTMLAGMSAEEKEARKYGKFMAASGLIYPAFNPALHVINPIDPMGIVHSVVTGMDHGLRNPTAWLWAYVDGEGRIVIFHEYYAAERTITDHAVEVNIYERATGVRPKVTYRIGDPAIAQRNPLNGESVQTEYSRDDLYVGLGNNDVGYGLNRVRRLLETGGLLITRDCTQLIRELHSYRWAQYSSMRIRENKQARDAPEKKNDHCVDALRYLVCSRPEDEFLGSSLDPLHVPQTAAHTVPANENYTEREFLGAAHDEYHPVLGESW